MNIVKRIVVSDSAKDVLSQVVETVHVFDPFSEVLLPINLVKETVKILVEQAELLKKDTYRGLGATLELSTDSSSIDGRARKALKREAESLFPSLGVEDANGHRFLSEEFVFFTGSLVPVNSKVVNRVMDLFPEQAPLNLSIKSFLSDNVIAMVPHLFSTKDWSLKELISFVERNCSAYCYTIRDVLRLLGGTFDTPIGLAEVGKIVQGCAELFGNREINYSNVISVLKSLGIDLDREVPHPG